MAQALSGLLILLVAIVTANAPFLSERLFGLLRPRKPKSAGVRFLELAVFYLVTLGLAILIETRFGPRYPQRWEFYGITGCLFMVLGYPGFVWRYLRGGGARARSSEAVEQAER